MSVSIISSQIIANIRDILAKLPSQETSEIEVRYGQFSGNSFISGINRRIFTRIKDKYSRFNPTYTHTKDEIFRDSYNPGTLGWPFDKSTTERYTTVYDRNGLPTETYRLVKQKNRMFDIPEYFIRIAVSQELIDNIQKPDTQPIFLREKKRWSYSLNSGRFLLDLTEVTTYKPGSNDPRLAKTVYEIELEIQGDKIQNLDNLNTVTTILLKEVQGTFIIYTSKEKSDVISNINRLIGGSIRPSNIDLNAIIQPRNLKIRDLVIGSLVPLTNRDVNYSVTIKADGTRKLLYIDRLGMYLVYADEVLKFAGPQKSQRLQTWYGTVFECELITKLQPNADNKYKQALIYGLIYDTLAIGGNSGVRNNGHIDRLKHAENFMVLIQSLKNIIFEVKQFNLFTTVSEFYNTTNLTLLASYPFYTDGLIYTPSNYRYDPSVNLMKLKDRRLNRQPDIMKWKPPSQLTIDFAIQHSVTSTGNFIELLSSQRGQLIPFAESEFNNQTDISITPELQNAPNGTVFEFAWTEDKFTVVRPRYDKPYPNKIEVAKDVWEDIHNPIDEDTIRGKKFNLAARYHNKVKWELYNDVKQSLPQKLKTRTLLDIGSGKGGDVNKWSSSGFTHIICVEPDENNRLELLRRLNNLNEERTKNNQPILEYRIIPTNGQDVETIVKHVREFAPNKFVDVVSYMLSLSFFFGDGRSINSIIQLINETLTLGGYFISLTIDGRYVLEYFNQPGNYIETNGTKRSTMNLIDFEIKPPYNVFINIPNSIVTNQAEYLTNIPGLQQTLQNLVFGNQKAGLNVIKEWRTDKEKFMTTDELQFSSLFTAFIMKRG